MLVVQRSKGRPFGASGPLRAFQLATGEENDLQEWIAGVRKALSPIAVEELAGFVFGKTADGRWACVRRAGEWYEWIIHDPGTPLGEISHPNKRSSPTVIIRPPTAEIARRARELFYETIDRETLTREFARGAELIREIEREGDRTQ